MLLKLQDLLLKRLDPKLIRVVGNTQE